MATSSESHIMATAQTTSNPKLTRRLQSQLGMLVAQFLLGMAVNLLGDPKDISSPLAKFADQAFLVLHILLAIGLLVGAVQIARLTANLSPRTIKSAQFGGAAIGLAILGGLLTMSSPPLSGLWSYVMAAGFIAAIILYGRLLGEAMAGLAA